MAEAGGEGGSLRKSLGLICCYSGRWSPWVFPGNQGSPRGRGVCGAPASGHAGFAHGLADHHALELLVRKLRGPCSDHTSVTAIPPPPLPCVLLKQTVVQGPGPEKKGPGPHASVLESLSAIPVNKQQFHMVFTTVRVLFIIVKHTILSPVGWRVHCCSGVIF